MDSKDWNSFICSQTLKDLIEEDAKFEVVTVDHNDTLATALSTLQKAGVYSAPVMNSATGEFVGIIDMLDLVAFAALQFAEVGLMAWQSELQMSQFATKKVGDLAGLSGRNSPHTQPISYKSTVGDTMQRFASNVNTHRLCVTNEAGDIVYVLSQSKMVDWVYRHRDKLPSGVLQTPIRELRLEGQVESMRASEFVINGFLKIFEQTVTGLAVVDDAGVLVGNLSASDLKRAHVTPVGEMIHDLYQPVQNFLTLRTSPDKPASKVAQKPICVRRDDSFETAVTKIMDANVHRVYIVDEAQHPTGVISLYDLISVFRRAAAASAR